MVSPAALTHLFSLTDYINCEYRAGVAQNTAASDVYGALVLLQMTSISCHIQKLAVAFDPFRYL